MISSLLLRWPDVGMLVRARAFVQIVEVIRSKIEELVQVRLDILRLVLNFLRKVAPNDIRALLL